jgi:hypothetical protein
MSLVIIVLDNDRGNPFLLSNYLLHTYVGWLYDLYISLPTCLTGEKKKAEGEKRAYLLYRTLREPSNFDTVPFESSPC